MAAVTEPAPGIAIAHFVDDAGQDVVKGRAHAGLHAV